ncbi:MAG: glycosyltransferase [Candidatus Omnitrophota bacterium]
MLISVIITTKNEEKNIENCLNSVVKQSYPQDNIEIIVVDNNSADKTKEFALCYTDKVYNFGPERSAQRNFGVEKSSGEYFLYLDADMALSENVVKDCVDKVKNNPEIIALYISEVITGKSFFSKVRKFERSFYDGTVIDCARFIKKEPFNRVGGFDENLTGPEDWDLDKKLRNIGKLSLSTTPLYHNESEFNLKKYLSKKAYYSGKFGDYIAKWGGNDPDIKKQFGVNYRFFGVFIEDKKWRKVIAHPILTIGIFIFRFLVGINYLAVKFNKS